MSRDRKYLLITRNEDGQHALNKVLCFGTAVVLSFGFGKEAWSRNLGFMDYLGYSLGMAITYAPVAAAKVIKALRPSTDLPAAAQPASGGAD